MAYMMPSNPHGIYDATWQGKGIFQTMVSVDPIRIVGYPTSPKQAVSL